MGLLDGLIGGLMGGQQQGGNNPLLQMALQMLANRSDVGSSAGLGGLINAFQNAGLGEQLKSWIGTGANLPISADQLTAALGSDKIRDIAGQGPAAITTHPQQHENQRLASVVPPGR